ncbi:type II secretion system secretin GspD [Rhizobium alvei]|uniref:Type II secretion system secretin GspD n=1 Tax=Rhizobium alvei TaxID=1132659 RepID=A0ABT8YNC8_9HYPH|nr:type II secretion system secretin GspD [Rhizobium alvei]MDO6965236.1 type II secretion system secretin GspD [Rhizobium alvei]
MDGVGQNKALSHNDGSRTKVVRNNQQLASNEPFIVPGSGQFVSDNRAAISHAIVPEDGGYTLNLVGAPIAEVAKRVLGDIMAYNYMVDARVKGEVTLQTTNPVSKDALMEVLETALAVNHAAIVKRGDRYDIVPESEALKSAPTIDVSATDAKGPGLRLQVVQLRYISAAEMKNILEPITQKGTVLKIDSKRNFLLVAGNSAELKSVRDAVGVFDVDFMKGMSVGLFPLKTAKPTALVVELNTVFGLDAGSKTIRFLPNERLNSVLAITSRQEYLPKVAAWIRKLDRIAETNDEQLFVYEIQNRPAQELATVLQSVLATGETAQKTTNVAPNLTPASYTADPNASEGEQPLNAADQSATVSESEVSAPRIVADVEKNALLISTTAREYRRIERILEQLDVMPTQVFLEAIIAEVTLNDQLKFGLSWYFEQGSNAYTLTDTSNGVPTPSFPGFSWTLSAKDVQSALNAISSVTKVKVISSPNLMVTNNQKATLQVGDQVPIVTQTTANTTAGTSAIVNSIDLKDTGIILSVTPRINSSGRVMLDIQQEVSDVVQTTSSGIDSPTIQQRKLSTRVMVNDGESLALGGLIQERKGRTEKKLPVLGDVPLVGNAFKSKLDTISRTELVIFIRPRVIRSTDEARQITDEFRQKMDFGQSDTASKRIKRDANRLLQ